MRARKSSGPGANRSAGRLGLAVLVAAVAAFLLIPVAQAAAAGKLTVNVIGTGDGEVTKNPGYVGNEFECKYESPGPAGPECEPEMKLNGESNDEEDILSIAAAGSEVASVELEKGTELNEEFFGPGYGCNDPVGQAEFVEFFGGWGCYIQGEAEEAGAEVTVCFVLEGEGEEGCEPPIEPNVQVNIEEGEGSVVSSPAGIECPSKCGAKFEGAVTLTASPAPGYLFKSWKKCDKKELVEEVQYGVNGRQCTVKSTAELKEVGANFIKVWDLTISKASGSGPGIAKTKPGGIVCLYACTTATAAYKDIAAPGGKPVEVALKPAKHFHFVEFLNGTGQTEACNGKNGEEGCSYSPSGEDSSIEVLFEEDAKNTLSLSKEGGGQGFIKTKPAGILCGYTCGSAEAEYYAADTAVVSIKLNKGTNSLEWVSGAGTCTGTVETTESTCEVPMSSAHELVAKFE